MWRGSYLSLCQLALPAPHVAQQRVAVVVGKGRRQVAVLALACGDGGSRGGRQVAGRQGDVLRAAVARSWTCPPDDSRVKVALSLDLLWKSSAQSAHGMLLSS